MDDLYYLTIHFRILTMLLAASTTHAVVYLWLQCTYLETGRTIRLEPAYVYWATDHVISIH